MDLTNLVLRVQDFNIVVSNPGLMNILYSLTLYQGKLQTGMTYELDQLTKISKLRPVDARVILVEKDNELIAWCLLSREASDFMSNSFFSDKLWFDPDQHGTLCEIFVKEEFRRQGIGKEILKLARRKSNPYPLCFVPWDPISRSFYANFKHYNHRII
jgi:hypothetical protein